MPRKIAFGIAKAVIIVLSIGIGVVGSSSSHSSALARRAGIAEIQGEGFWYEDSGGSGAPVVLLHAGTGNSDYWRDEAVRLETAGFRVITYDRRGWGKTTALPQKGTSAALDLVHLADYLKLSRFNLIGIASGGRVALSFGAEHSERLLSLIVASSAGPAFRDEGEPELKAYSSRIGQMTLSPAQRELSSTYRGDNPDGVKRWEEIQKGSKNPDAVDLMGTPLTYAKIGLISAPTLVVAGGADILVPPGYSILWASHIPKSWWVVVPSAAHSIPWEQPKVFADIVTRFMRGDRHFKRSVDCLGKEDLGNACLIPRVGTQ